MKAWRIEAEKINARRKAGSKEPVARQQKGHMHHHGAGISWLLDALLVRGGYIKPLHERFENAPVGVTKSLWSRFVSAMSRLITGVKSV